jgi:hypothetical protein
MFDETSGWDEQRIKKGDPSRTMRSRVQKSLNNNTIMGKKSRGH